MCSTQGRPWREGRSYGASLPVAGLLRFSSINPLPRQCVSYENQLSPSRHVSFSNLFQQRRSFQFILDLSYPACKEKQWTHFSYFLILSTCQRKEKVNSRNLMTSTNCSLYLSRCPLVNISSASSEAFYLPSSISIMPSWLINHNSAYSQKYK